MEGWMAEDMESKEAALARALRQCAARPEECSEKNCIFFGQSGCIRILKTCAAETLEQADRSKPVAPGKAVLLTAEQVQNGKGVGWHEAWYAAEPEQGTEEYKELRECVFIAGNVMLRDGSCGWEYDLQKGYNKKYGERIWIGAKPTDEEREKTPWNGK